MPWRQAHTLFRHQLQKRVVRCGQMLVHSLHHLVTRLRAGYRQQGWKARFDHLRAAAETAGDDYPSVLLQRLIDGLQRFIDRGLDKTAGIDDHHIGVVVIGDDGVTLGAQPCDHLFRIDRRLGAAETDKSYPGSRRAQCRSTPGKKNSLTSSDLAPILNNERRPQIHSQSCRLPDKAISNKGSLGKILAIC